MPVLTGSGPRAAELRALPPHDKALADPAQVALWTAVARGERTDWNSVCDAYAAQVGRPGLEADPRCLLEAKVVHNERPEEEWWAASP